MFGDSRAFELGRLSDSESDRNYRSEPFGTLLADELTQHEPHIVLVSIDDQGCAQMVKDFLINAGYKYLDTVLPRGWDNGWEMRFVKG
jgi:hypothetical protein